MKERLGNILRVFTAAIADAALSLLLIMLMLSLYDMERTMHPALRLWALTLLLQAVVNEFLSRHSPSLLFYGLVNAALLLIGRHYILAHTAFIPGSQGFPVLLSMLMIAGGAHAAFASYKLPGSDFFVRMTDILIIAASLYMFAAFCMGHAFHMPVLLFVLLTFALLLITTAALRAGGESDSVIRGTGIGGWLVLAALLALCLLFTSALLSLGSGHVNSLVDVLSMLWQASFSALSACMKALAYLLAFFIRPGSMRREYAVSDGAALPEMEIGDAAPPPPWVTYVMFALFAALILVAFAAIIWALHNTKLSRRRTKRRRRRVVRKSHFFSALRNLIMQIAACISFELACFFGRRTPQGLLILAQRTGALHKLPRKKSESGGAYLRRLHGVLTAQKEPSSLDALAAALDAIFYGGKQITLTRAEYESYAQQIRRIRLPSAGKEMDKEPDKKPEP